MRADTDLVFAVLGVQLGYFTPDDALAGVRDLLPHATTSLPALLEARGVLHPAQREVLERLAARAVHDSGGDAAHTLELLPGAARALLSESEPNLRPVARKPGDRGEPLCEEQPGRYLNAPDPDGPPLELARSPAGIVVLKHDTVFGRDVAWRSALGDARLEAQLLAEAQLTGQLDHPAVLPVFEVGRATTGALYVTTQQPGARTLADALAAARTTPARLALVPALHTVAQCLAAAHENGATHRALSARAVSLGDFGAVFVTGWAATATGEPRSHRDDRLADVRALGALLLQVAIGAASTDDAADAPADLVAVARRASEGALSIDELTAELKLWLDGRQVQSYRYSTAQLARRAFVRNRGFLLAALLTLAALLVAGLVTYKRLEAERDHARQFARRFLDDVSRRLQALPGVEPLIDQVTRAALAHYQRTKELDHGPVEERLRVAQGMTRLATVSIELGRLDEGAQSLEFARGLIDAVLAERPGEVAALVASVAARLAAVDLDSAREVAFAVSVPTGRLAVAEADRALASSPDALEVIAAAVRARLALREIEDAPEVPVLITRAVELSNQALARFPDQVDAQALVSEALAARAVLQRLELDPTGALASTSASVAAMRKAVAARPDDPALQISLIDRLSLEGAAARAVDDAVLARAALEEASERCELVLRRQPAQVVVRQALVEIEINLGHAEQAWRNLRALEAQGHLGRMIEAAPAVAFYSRHFDDAVRYSLHPGASTMPTAILYRGLAQAVLGQPSEAVVAARALRDDIANVLWARGLGGPAVAEVEGAGAGAVQTFIASYDAAVPVTDVQPLRDALERLISALEAQLPPK